MVDFARLSTHWYQWASGMGGPPISVSRDCPDCQIHFSTADYSVHLRSDGSWWVVDTVNDRGYRRNGAAKLSSFDLAEKYLIWRWAASRFPGLASGQLGANLARKGFAPGVKVSQSKEGHEICSAADCAILSVVDATIFSHLISKSVEEIEQMIQEGLR